MSDTLYAQVSRYASANPSQRYGQAAFNYIHAKYPVIANELRGTDLDPFYDSGKTMTFLAAVEARVMAREQIATRKDLGLSL
jgi:hypothetical protein